MTPITIHQIIHTLDGRIAHLPEHLRLLENWGYRVFGSNITLDQTTIETEIRRLLARDNSGNSLSVYVRLTLDASGTTTLTIDAPSIYRGYALRTIHPLAAVIHFTPPFGDIPTSNRDAFLADARQLAHRLHSDIAIRCNHHEELRSIEGCPLFMIKGYDVYTPPSIDCVARSVAQRAIQAAGLTLQERRILSNELDHCDELFYCDHRGITSIEGVAGMGYMHVLVESIAEKLSLEKF